MNEITMIPLNLLEHHPKNPRTDLGDLSELAESIRNRGVMQNLTVVPDAESKKYLVVIGNRRLEAAKIAGLVELPCHISMMDEKEQMATMLMENMQRQDLTIWEQAHGFQMMMDLGFSAKEIGEKTGFSERTVAGRIKLTKFRKKEFEEACQRGATLMEFAELDRIEDAKTRYELMSKAGTMDFKIELTTALKKQEYAKHEKRITALMKSLGIKELPANERYSSAYERREGIAVEESDEAIIGRLGRLMKLDESPSDFRYYLSPYYGKNGTLDIYHTAKKAGGLTEAEKQQRAKSRRMNDHCRKVKKIYEDAFEARMDFVKRYTCSNFAGLRTAVGMIAQAGLDYKNSWNDEIPMNKVVNDKYIRQALDLPEAGAEGTTGKTVWAIAFDKEIPDARLLLAWAMYGGAVCDTPDQGWYDRSDGNWLDPSKNSSRFYTTEIERVYNLLTGLGYQMTEMELQLRAGTHPCYAWDD